ncbi:MAG: TPM domain-containing protein [Cytophagaceae bacterium]|jgi:uncharacterized membrane protein|nr:TPM domain-containing protein [Cytophagaceae bacterium]
MINLLNKSERERIVSAIHQAECSTSGEIRVHIESICKEEVLDRATYLFETLEMHKTAQRNGVLFYVAIKNRQFAILGDSGVNTVVAPDFWENIKETMTEFFKKGDFDGGLEKGILMAGEQLKTHFPYSNNDKNELPDEISFGK